MLATPMITGDLRNIFLDKNKEEPDSMIGSCIHEWCVNGLGGKFLKGQRVLYMLSCTVLYNPLVLVIRSVFVDRE